MMGIRSRYIYSAIISLTIAAKAPLRKAEFTSKAYYTLRALRDIPEYGVYLLWTSEYIPKYGDQNNQLWHIPQSIKPVLP